MALVGTISPSSNVGSSLITTGLGYTPVNKAGDTITGTINLSAPLKSSDGSLVRKQEMSGTLSGGSGGSQIKKIEEMINFYHVRNTTRYFKLNIASRYATDPQGAALTLTLGKFSEHASLNHWRTYKLLFGSGNGGDPSTYQLVWYTEKEVTAGWNYYGTTFTTALYYPSSGSNRNYCYFTVSNADNQGSVQSAHSFLHLEGFIGTVNDGISGTNNTLQDLGSTQPSDWGSFSLVGNSGTW